MDFKFKQIVNTIYPKHKDLVTNIIQIKLFIYFQQR